MKLKVLKSMAAAAVALAIGAAANAAPIVNDQLFFSAWNGNPDAASSILINMTVTTNAFDTNASWSLGATETAALSSWVSSLTPAGQAGLRWTVVGSLGTPVPGDLSGGPDYGLLSTGVSSTVEVPFQDWGLFGGLENAVVTQLPGFLILSNPNLQSSNVWTTASANAVYEASTNGGPGFEGQAPLNESMSFYRIFADETEPFFTGDSEKYGQWALNYAGGTASLVYSPGGGTAPVPVPAALWLMLSGAGALVGVARRRKVQAA